MSYEPLSFTPMSDKQIEDLTPKLKAGIANYEVMTAEKKESKKGNPMIEVKFKVFDEDGTQGMTRDFLLTSENMQWKLKSFCRSAGLMDRYEQGKLAAEDILCKSGKCKIKPQKDEPKYMQIAEYLVMDGTQDIAEKKAAENNDADFDDDITF